MTSGRRDTDPDGTEVRVARLDALAPAPGRPERLVAEFGGTGSSVDGGPVAESGGTGVGAVGPRLAGFDRLGEAGPEPAPVARVDRADEIAAGEQPAVAELNRLAPGAPVSRTADLGDVTAARGRRAGGAGSTRAEPARSRRGDRQQRGPDGPGRADVVAAAEDPGGVDPVVGSRVGRRGAAGGRGRSRADPAGPDAGAVGVDEDRNDATAPGSGPEVAVTGPRRRGRSGSGGPPGSARSRGAPAELDPDADPVAVAREICLRLLTDRARTRQELAQVLHRKGVPDDAASAVLERFDEVGLIDDAAFANQWVRSRHTYRGLGRRAIAVELRRKGVADDVAGEALAEVDSEAEARRARELVDRKLRSLTVATAEQRATAGRRLVGMLARKGYGAGVAYGVVREALAEHGADVEELGSGEPPEE